MDPEINPTPETAPAGDGPGTTPGDVFYNVMPTDVAGPMVSSEIETPVTPSPIPPAAPTAPAVGNTPVANPSVSNNPNEFRLPRSHRKMTSIVGLVVVLAILAVAGWFGYRYAKQHRQQAVTNENINTEPANTNEDNNTKSGVTTPAEWQKRYFSSETCDDLNVCGDEADPDRDGLNNLEEYNTKTDPNNADSDSDGLADGDEVHVFGGSPLTSRTNSGEDYLDSDYAKGGYDITTNVKFTDTQLQDIKNKIKDKGLHQPTIKTLGADNLKQYDFTDPSIPTSSDSSSVDSSIDQSPTAKLARDTQRSADIQKIAAALLKYKQAKGAYPDTQDIAAMAAAVKPYVTVATKFEDPINKDKYVYGYVSANAGKEFTLLYFSETQNIVIKYTSQQAELDSIKQNASANDDKRRRDLENIAFALGLYSDAHVEANSTQDKVYPPNLLWKTELVPAYLTELPKDPRTGQDYYYQVGDHFDTFTLKAVFDNPTKGQTGYMCNQDECKTY